MSKLKQIAESVIVAGENRKTLWAGAEFFPLKEFAAGLYLSIGPVRSDDKEVYVSEANNCERLARAVIILEEALKWYLGARWLPEGSEESFSISDKAHTALAKAEECVK